MRRIPLILSLLLAALTLTPVQAAPPASPPPTFTAWLVSAPPTPICPGDQVAISLMAMETTQGKWTPAAGYPMNILQSSPAVGVLDPISAVMVNGTANFVYKANDGYTGGTQTDTLTFNIGGYPTGLTVPITVYGKCDYKMDLLMEASNSADNVELREVITAEATMVRASGQMHGEGTDHVIFTIFGTFGGVFLCELTPPVQASSTLQADGTVQPVGPGVETVYTGIDFELMRPNSAVLRCQSLVNDGMNIKAEYPFDMSKPWDPDEMGLESIPVTMSNYYGSTEVSYKAARGRLTLSREVSR